MFSDVAIVVQGLGKCYQIYESPRDRLKQFIFPRIRRLFRLEEKKYYKEFWALKNAEFIVKQGETVGVIGRNGSGKSTLLQLICGTLNPSSGYVKTNGRVAALLELGSGFNAEFTGAENIYMNAAVLGLKKEEIDRKFGEIVSFSEIGEFINQPVKTYSSGMYVRLAFAVIAHVDADILIIDEALAVGDAFFTQKCMRFLREFMKKGTVIFVSHDSTSVTSLCNRCIWLDSGVVREIGNPKEVTENYLEAIYEEQQGKSRVPKTSSNDSLLESPLTNKDDVKFKPKAFGAGGATINSVELVDYLGDAIAVISGMEDVTLRVECTAHQTLNSPIIGFFVKDKTGQLLFGDNTFITTKNNACRCMMGEKLTAEFAFRMPRLAPGQYTITVAIADGTQLNHVQHEWVHDALMFTSGTTCVTGGLMGIPMDKIILKAVAQ